MCGVPTVSAGEGAREARDAMTGGGREEEVAA
jgi:hypothetical protein